MTLQAASRESFSTLNLTENLVGESAAMIELKRTARCVPAQTASLLIAGENGTGKESLARYLHQHSLRANSPFVPVDCSSLSDTLLESELFGLKGTSDDSTRDSLGFIRAADGGSIFLDEISQLSLPLQGKLLRVLRDKAVTPVGAVTSHPVDVRIIAATNRDLDAMVQQGHFLGDLFQLLGSCVLRTPPLRDRLADIVPLAHHFLAILAELHDEPLKMISDPVIQVLQTYPWPGNVRELSNILEQAHVLASNDSLQLSDLPLRLQVGVRQATEIPESLSLDELEKQAILTALRRCNFNRAAAGRMLGISTPRLKRRIARLGL